MTDKTHRDNQSQSESPTLSPCPPTKRNCVCSLDSSVPHHIPPLDTHDENQAIFDDLRNELSANARYRLIQSTPTYLYAEYHSPFFGFIDDVEFSLSPLENKIHVRSASRVGYWDLGANRRRIEWFRNKYTRNGPKLKLG